MVNVPHGIKSSNDEKWIRSFCIRELNGYDEDYLNRLGINFPTPIKTTELLTRLVISGYSGSNEKISYANSLKIDKEKVRELTIGDRISLLLQIRRFVMGDKIGCEVTCPECKNLMSIDLKVSEILQPLEHDPKRKYHFEIDGISLELRPVNGKDQESLLELDSKSDLMQYEDYIIRRCLLSADPSLPKSLSTDLVAKASMKLDELDPQAHLVLDITCPSCSNHFQIPFLHEDFIFEEIYTRYELAHQEIHLLAFYYHWTEKEILSLPTTTRKRYAELIVQTIKGG